MKNYYYLDNAFWENEQKTALKCIRVTKLENGSEKSDVLAITNTDPLWEDVIKELTIAGINASSAERQMRKRSEAQEESIKDAQTKKASQLEKLFELKLKAFDIEAIKNSENRALRTKLRRAVNEIELNAVATLIIGTELGIFGNSDE